MARNEEKAQSMLYRFREAQAAELGVVKQKERRPHLASEVNNLPEAEKWRRQVIGEVSRKVSKIQDAGLSDYQVRDLNDEINKLMREKMHWESRIKELGGPDYWKIGPRMLDNEGREVPGNRGYKYFGRAKDLPGVRELFEQEAPEAPKRSRFDMYRNVDADYYGYRDEEDGLLLEFEREQERALIQRALVAGEGEVELDEEAGDGAEAEAEAMEIEVDKKELKKKKGKSKGKKAEAEAQAEAAEAETQRKAVEVVTDKYVAHVAVPSQKEVEEYLVRRRRQQLLDKYVSQDLEENAKETRELTGKS